MPITYPTKSKRLQGKARKSKVVVHRNLTPSEMREYGGKIIRSNTTRGGKKSRSTPKHRRAI